MRNHNNIVGGWTDSVRIYGVIMTVHLTPYTYIGASSSTLPPQLPMMIRQATSHDDDEDGSVNGVIVWRKDLNVSRLVSDIISLGPCQLLVLFLAIQPSTVTVSVLHCPLARHLLVPFDLPFPFLGA